MNFWNIILSFYIEPTDLLVWGAPGADGIQPLERLLSRSGQQQGDTLGSFLFAVGIQPVLKDIRAAFPNVLVRAICDDVHLAGTPGEVSAAFAMLRDGFAKQALTLKYGPTKTCCWSPAFASAGPSDDARAAAARAACILPKEITRLTDGMKTLGSFIGTDTYVASQAIAHVDCTLTDDTGTLISPDSIHNVCDKIAELASSACRNACDIAGHLLRMCVTSKVSYLARTVRPDLFRGAAARADALITATFCKVFSIDPDIFAASASPRDRLAAQRVQLPTALKGCGLRSAVATSDTAYYSSWRAAAKAIAASSSPAAKAALSFASRCDPAFPPALAAVARIATKFSSLLPDLRTDLDLATFATTSPPRHLQHTITQAAESALLASAVAAANLNLPDKAHFNGCCGRWIQASRVCFSAASGVSQQLTCDEAKLRMQNYLRQPLSVLAPYVGKTTPGHSTNGAAIVVDELGDNLGGYHAPEDAEWIWFHNALRDCLRACAQCSGITTGIEKRARRPVGDESDGAAASNGAAVSDGGSGDLRARRAVERCCQAAALFVRSLQLSHV